MENVNWDKLVQQTAYLVNSHEKYQRVLGQIAYEIGQEFGLEALPDFAEDIKEAHGLSVALTSLQNYEYVYRQTKDLELPDDLSYRTLQYIASSGKPDFWANEIKEKGLSSAEVYRQIREDKGFKDKKTVKCPHCGVKFYISKPDYAKKLIDPKSYYGKTVRKAPKIKEA